MASVGVKHSMASAGVIHINLHIMYKSRITVVRHGTMVIEHEYQKGCTRIMIK